MLREIQRQPPNQELERKAALFESAIREEIQRSDLAGCVTFQRVGSLATLFFAPGPIVDFASARRCDTARFSLFFHVKLERGIFLPPSQFEAWFLSAAHTGSDLRRAARALSEALPVALGNVASGPKGV